MTRMQALPPAEGCWPACRRAAKALQNGCRQRRAASSAADRGRGHRALQKITAGGDRMLHDGQKNVPDAESDGVGGVDGAASEADEVFLSSFAAATGGRAGSGWDGSARCRTKAESDQKALDAASHGRRCRIDRKWAYLRMWLVSREARWWEDEVWNGKKQQSGKREEGERRAWAMAVGPPHFSPLLQPTSCGAVFPAGEGAITGPGRRGSSGLRAGA